MVKSMTGYGRAVETVNGREFTVELRSVNNRYLDCTVKLPRMLSFAEDAVKQAVKATISRGKVDVYITVHAEGASDVKVTLNQPMVEGYLAAMKQMVADYGVQDDISVLLETYLLIKKMKLGDVSSEVTISEFFTLEIAKAWTIPVCIDRFLKSCKIVFSHCCTRFFKIRQQKYKNMDCKALYLLYLWRNLRLGGDFYILIHTNHEKISSSCSHL